jgi:hypothetical protein
MKAFRQSGKRIIGGVLLCASLALLALQPLAARASGLAPTIGAWVQYGSVIHVSGSHFAPGSGVLVTARDAAHGWIVSRAETTASSIIVRCAPQPYCQYALPAPGTISVTMPPHAVHCGYERVSVRAFDLTTRTFSNTVYVTLGTGPC